MLKHAAKTRRATGSSVTTQITAIVIGCTLVAGGVSAAEISMLNGPDAVTSISTEIVP
ncbi:hypothetical protein J2M53_11265 [Arthrobacter sp. zg-ZUI100]|uniref:hypothetical protein n=1 Tax=Arthrobacter jiangjiafuii TaxID=2817475 RepID=UPI001AEDE37F|nr:hypothetical protein [Arthrobacter jiangjiafuii]MBP3036824.1 hypothetical protein [Arthrobacter jiangjiafuii]